jgi:hypothetical protein
MNVLEQRDVLEQRAVLRANVAFGLGELIWRVFGCER